MSYLTGLQDFRDNLQILGEVANHGRTPGAQRAAKSAIGKVLVGGFLGAAIGGGLGALLLTQHRLAGGLVGALALGAPAGMGIGMYLSRAEVAAAKQQLPPEKPKTSLERVLDALTPAAQAAVSSATAKKPAPAAATPAAASGDGKPPANSPLLFSMLGRR